MVIPDPGEPLDIDASAAQLAAKWPNINVWWAAQGHWVVSLEASSEESTFRGPTLRGALERALEWRGLLPVIPRQPKPALWVEVAKQGKKWALIVEGSTQGEWPTRRAANAVGETIRATNRAEYERWLKKYWALLPGMLPEGEAPKEGVDFTYVKNGGYSKWPALPGYEEKTQ